MIIAGSARATALMVKLGLTNLVRDIVVQLSHQKRSDVVAQVCLAIPLSYIELAFHLPTSTTCHRCLIDIVHSLCRSPSGFLSRGNSQWSLRLTMR